MLEAIDRSLVKDASRAYVFGCTAMHLSSQVIDQSIMHLLGHKLIVRCRKLN